jgi:hypothetical protein
MFNHGDYEDRWFIVMMLALIVASGVALCWEALTDIGRGVVRLFRA